MSIKQQIIDYRNHYKNDKIRIILGVVLGEFDRLEKSPKRNGKITADDEAVAIIKKMIQSNNECGISGENEILELFIPIQLNEYQISDILINLKVSNIKECMDHFKIHYSGRFDGKIVSKIYKEINN